MLNNEKHFEMLNIDSNAVRNLVSRFTDEFTMKDIIELIKKDIRENHSDEETFSGTIEISDCTIKYYHDKNGDVFDPYKYYLYDGYLLYVKDEKYTLFTITNGEKCLYASFTDRYRITGEGLFLRYGFDTEDESDCLDIKIDPDSDIMEVVENKSFDESLSREYAMLSKEYAIYSFNNAGDIVLNENSDSPFTRIRRK